MIRVLIAGPIARVVDDIEKLEPHHEAIDVCGVAHQASAVVAEVSLRHPDVVVVHDGFADCSSADLVRDLEAASPGTHVLLLPAEGGGDLVAAIRQAAGGDPEASADPGVVPPRRERATVVVTFSGKGGAGTSMLAANLAVALAAGGTVPVAVVDTDLQYGDVAAMLHADHHVLSIADVAAHGEAVDPGLLDEALAEGPGGVRVLRSPSSPELAGSVTAATLRAIVRALGRTHAFVVVDTPRSLDERTLEAFELADRVMIVTADTTSAVKGSVSTLRFLEALGVDSGRVSVVLNHSRPRAFHQRDAVEALLGSGVAAELPFEAKLDASIDAGDPIVHSGPRSDLTRRLTELAASVGAGRGLAETAAPTEIDAPPPAPAYRRRFSLGRR